MKKTDFKVFVLCCTYNQSKFIEKTMDGFTMQKTSFPFVCCIIDDASIDGEQTVIKEYINKHFKKDDNSVYYERNTYYGSTIFAQNKNNSNCFFSVHFLKENHYSKKWKKRAYYQELSDSIPYWAMCEGDDYWIDHYKLQLQYKYMIEHPECSLCFHKYDVLFNDVIQSKTNVLKEDYNILEVACGVDVQTATMFYRNVSEPIVPEDFNFKYPVYQFFWVIRLAEYGYIHCFNKVMSVYRVNQGGIYSQQNLRRKIEMALGNIDNMINWYSNRVVRDDVVKILKKRARLTSMGFMRIALRQRKFKDFGFLIMKYLGYVG